MIRKFINDLKDTLEENETVRINHDGCPAGTDTRRRLYITKKPQVILGYCHNCQQSAAQYIAAKDRFKPLAKDDSTYQTIDTGVEFKYPFSEEIDAHSPADVTVWRQTNGLTIQDCNDWEIMYVPEEHAIRTPIVTTIGTQNGYQLRPLSNGGAKYITHLIDETVPMGGFLHLSSNIARRVVIVEDYISATKIASCGYFAVCNYGVQVKPEILSQLPDEEDVSIWLDNDSNHVKKKAKDMQAICQLLGYETRLITKDAEPKHLDAGNIWRVLAYGRT